MVVLHIDVYREFNNSYYILFTYPDSTGVRRGWEDAAPTKGEAQTIIDREIKRFMAENSMDNPSVIIIEWDE